MDEYRYSEAGLGHHAAYISPALVSMLKNVPAGSVVADVGCGNGSMLAQFQQRGWELHGLEMSRSGLEIATKTYPGITFDFADFGADLSQHRLAGKCDVVISTEVVEHVFLPRVFAKNCHALLKPAGQLIITTPYHGYLKDLTLAVTAKMDQHRTALWDYGHIKFWSRKTLTYLLQEAGFSVTHFKGLGRAPFLWKSMLLIAQKR